MKKTVHCADCQTELTKSEAACCDGDWLCEVCYNREFPDNVPFVVASEDSELDWANVPVASGDEYDEEV